MLKKENILEDQIIVKNLLSLLNILIELQESVIIVTHFINLPT